MISKNRSGGIVRRAVILLACLWVFAMVYRTSKSVRDGTLNTSGAPAAVANPSSPAVPPIAVSASELSAKYHRNEVAADEEFKGRRVDVQGVVESIRKDFLDHPIVSLRVEGNRFESVNCTFAKGSAGLGGLSPGDQVTVHGVCTGMVIGSVQIDCK